MKLSNHDGPVTTLDLTRTRAETITTEQVYHGKPATPRRAELSMAEKAQDGELSSTPSLSRPSALYENVTVEPTITYPPDFTLAFKAKDLPANPNAENSTWQAKIDKLQVEVAALRTRMDISEHSALQWEAGSQTQQGFFSITFLDINLILQIPALDEMVFQASATECEQLRAALINPHAIQAQKTAVKAIYAAAPRSVQDSLAAVRVSKSTLDHLRVPAAHPVVSVTVLRRFVKEFIEDEELLREVERSVVVPWGGENRGKEVFRFKQDI
ncbi:hypothetical protein B0H16DRAFT_1447715 [Mycena metata]|uniref:Uncharacterized protein n=1 Tax=Mycena metata TaxID=1033252 RepID=A0AAD7KBM1_9AGAR|nr:hypothetical protein B0H16DRAFT_1447715 [Mycena metata]